MFKKTLMLRALAAAFGSAVLSSAIAPMAYAQSNATGSIFGNTGSIGDGSVVIESTETGAKRTAKADATGRFLVTSLPPGAYKVQLLKGDAVVATVQLEVRIGQGAEAKFEAKTDTATKLESVEIAGRTALIDASSSNNGVTFTARQLAELPVARNVDAIIQLAPNTTRADSRYAGGASFGGGGPSENSFYINGFPVTNPLTQLGASELPFGAISQAQVLTGGFGAEFGRSIGGVVNITTKRGSNTWEAGAQLSIAPSSLRATEKDIYYPVTGATENAGTDGKLFRLRSQNKVSETSIGGYVGGPLIKDELFMFVAFEQQKRSFSGLPTAATTANTNNETAGWSEQRDTTDRLLAKFDWNVTNDHRFEYTRIGDTPKRDERLSGFNYSTGAHNDIVSSSAHYTNVANQTLSTGADANIFKYTGNLTSDLTLTALYGKSKTKHLNEYDGYDIGQALYQVIALPANRAPGIVYNNPQPLTGNILPPGAQDTVKSFRLDLEYIWGDHTIRGGVDENKLSSVNAGDFRAGGGIYQYLKRASGTAPFNLGGATVDGRTYTGITTAAGGGLGVDGYYGRERIFTDVTNAYSDQSAQYIEDKIQISKELLLTVGLRNEEFVNKNGDGETFLEMKNQLNPRFAAAWDVNGDSSLKVFGSAGRYAVQIPTHIAVRGASRSTFTDQYYTYTGVDANGVPIGRVNISDPLSTNNEFGQAKDAKTVAALDMKPSSQDELTIGIEKALAPNFTGGARATYRVLRSTIDDMCDSRPFEAYAARNNIDTTNWAGFGCASFNPGLDNSFLVDYAGTRSNYTTVHLSKDELGFPSADRKYYALDFFLEHPYRSGWYGRINYTYSKSKGNTEGQTNSDTAQTDVAATAVWDNPELMEFANGLLPNNRKHQIKAYGFLDLTPSWAVGANMLAASGRPINCIGTRPDTDPVADYDVAFHWCNGVPAPRGTAGTLPWDLRLDLNITYKPEAVKGFALRADLFNAFNRQTTQTVDELYNQAGGGGFVSPTYLRTISYTAPKSIKFTAVYDHKF